MHRLKEKYTKTVVSALRETFGYDNIMQAPRIEKITVNVGVGKAKDSKVNDLVIETLTRITGQKPVATKAKKSISNFKLRAGNVVGMMTVLRGQRMYDFLDKLINVTWPRVRDFRGINPKSVDRSGNLTVGFNEHMAFPEIHADEVELIHGLEVTITTSAK